MKNLIVIVTASLLLAGCATRLQNVGLGAAVGAGAGCAIGSIWAACPVGAAVGAGAGAAAGALYNGPRVF